MGGVSQQLGGRAQLEQPALLEHGDPPGQSAGLLKGVGDEQRGEPEAPEGLKEGRPDLEPRYRVERAEGLVEQQHLRVSSERAGEGHPLTLAARELRGTCRRQMRDAEVRQQIGALAPGREANVLGDGHVREEPVLLRQPSHAALFRANVQRAPGVEPDLIAGGDPSLRRALEPGHGTQERGLAGPRAPDDGDRLGAEAQAGLESKASAREGDIDVEDVHLPISSLELSRIPALTMISRTPIAIAWSRFTSNRE